MRRQGAHYKVPFRRRRRAETDYRQRLRLLLSHEHRAVVRKTLNNMIVQVVAYDRAGDRVVASAVSRELVKRGWTAGTGNTAAAYLTGFLAGKRAVRSGVARAVLDIGMQSPSRGGRVFAVLRGLVDAGVSIPHAAEVLPTDDRIRGIHINAALPKAFDAVRATLEAE